MHTCNSLCLLRILTSPSPTTTTPKEHHPSQARKEVLKWQPLCIFYEVCLLQVSVPLHTVLITASGPSYSSELTGKLHSSLSPLLPACPCALGVSVSRQKCLRGVLLLYCPSQTPLLPLTSSRCQALSTTSALAPSTLRKQERQYLSGSLLPLAQEEGTCARPWGPSLLPSPCLYPSSVPNPN